MTIRILKKDLLLLWPYILAVAALWVLRAAVELQMGMFVPFVHAQMPFTSFSLLCTYASSLLLVYAVQQDTLVGVRSDWLARPVSRGQMLLAKLLFVLIAIRGPAFACDVVLALAHGASFATALLAAAASFSAFVNYDLVAFMIGAVTENMLQAIIAILIVVIVRDPLSSAVLQIFGGSYFNLPLLITWIAAALAGMVYVLAALIVLPLQYFRRRTLVSRIVLGAAVVAGALIAGTATTFLPWDTWFTVNARIYRNETAAKALSMDYARSIGRYETPDRDDLDNPVLYLPLRIANIPPHAIVSVANFRLHFFDRSGREVYSGEMRDSASEFERVVAGKATVKDRSLQERNPTDRALSMDVFQSWHLARETYQRLKDEKLRIKMDYSLVLLSESGTQRIGAAGAKAYLPGYGQCASERDKVYDTQVLVYCYAEPDIPWCKAVTVENHRGEKNPPVVTCGVDTAPRWTKLASLTQPASEVAGYYFDESVKDNPVKFAQLAQTDLVMTGYRPTVYFTRPYEIPNTRLTDLTAVYVSGMPRPSP